MEKYTLSIFSNEDNSQTYVASNKLIAFDFFKQSILVLDRLLHTHKGIHLDIPIEEGYNLLDTATKDIYKNFHGEFVSYRTSSIFNLKFELLTEKANVNGVRGKYLKFSENKKEEDVFAELSFDQEADYVNDLIQTIYNSFIAISTDYLESFIDPITNKKNIPVLIQAYIQNCIYDYYNNDEFKALNNDLMVVYDNVIHNQYPKVVVIQEGL